MREGIIYDCPNANCRTPIYTGKCSKACIEKYNKEMGKKPQTNADRIRAMSDEELSEIFGKLVHCGGCQMRDNCKVENLPCDNVLLEWLKQPVGE